MELSKMCRELADALEEVLRHDIANFGTDGEFVRCYSYAPFGSLPECMEKAKRVLERARKGGIK